MASETNKKYKTCIHTHKHTHFTHKNNLCKPDNGGAQTSRKRWSEAYAQNKRYTHINTATKSHAMSVLLLCDRDTVIIRSFTLIFAYW